MSDHGRIAKAFVFGRRGRGAFRSLVSRIVGLQAKSGNEHGFHRGKAGVDLKPQKGAKQGIRWSTRAAAGQALFGGSLHHSHPKKSPHLSRQDLRSVVTSENSAKHRNTLWAHSERGHEAARLSRTAAGMSRGDRSKAFNEAFRATKGPGSNVDHARRLRAELKRRGLIHSGSRIRKGASMNISERAAELIAKARGMVGAHRFEESRVRRDKRGRFAPKAGAPGYEPGTKAGEGTLAALARIRDARAALEAHASRLARVQQYLVARAGRSAPAPEKKRRRRKASKKSWREAFAETSTLNAAAGSGMAATGKLLYGSKPKRRRKPAPAPEKSGRVVSLMRRIAGR